MATWEYAAKRAHRWADKEQSVRFIYGYKKEGYMVWTWVDELSQTKWPDGDVTVYLVEPNKEGETLIMSLKTTAIAKARKKTNEDGQVRYVWRNNFGWGFSTILPMSQTVLPVSQTDVTIVVPKPQIDNEERQAAEKYQGSTAKEWCIRSYDYQNLFTEEIRKREKAEERLTECEEKLGELLSDYENLEKQLLYHGSSAKEWRNIAHGYQDRLAEETRKKDRQVTRCPCGRTDGVVKIHSTSNMVTCCPDCGIITEE